MAAFSAVARFTGDDRFSNVLTKMGANTKRFESKSRASFARVGQSVSNLRSKVNGLWSQIKTLAGIGGITALLLIGANAIKDYDAATASLQAITGATNQEMIGFRSEIAAVAKETKQGSTDIAKSFELVGSAKPELLASASALGEVTKQTVLLAKAGKLQTEDAVTALTVSLNQFGAGADQAAKFTDILATAQQKGSGTINFLAQAMVNAGGTSKAFGNSFEDTVAVLEGFAKAGVPASEAGTQLSGILAKLSTAQNKAFNPQFTKTTDIINNLTKANLSYNDLLKLTDARGAKWLTTIIGQNDIVQKLTGNLNDQGNAQAQAALNTATLVERFAQLKSSFENAIIAQSENSTGLKLLSGVLGIVADNLDWIVSLFAGLLAVILPVVAAYKIATGVQWLYNTAVGVAAIVQGKSAFALKGNAIALKAFSSVSKIATAAQWAFNAAMTANPIGLIIVIIAAVIAIIALLVKHWDTIKEKFQNSPTWVKVATIPLQLMLSPILILVNAIKKLMNAWDGIKAAFTDGGLIAGIKKIGGVLLSALIDPLVHLLKLIANIPGAGKLVNPLIDNIEGFQSRAEGGFGVDDDLASQAETEQPVNVQATEQVIRQEQIERGTLDININDPGQVANLEPGVQPIGVTVQSTTNNF